MYGGKQGQWELDKWDTLCADSSVPLTSESHLWTAFCMVLWFLVPSRPSHLHRDPNYIPSHLSGAHCTIYLRRQLHNCLCSDVNARNCAKERLWGSQYMWPSAVGKEHSSRHSFRDVHQKRHYSTELYWMPRSSKACWARRTDKFKHVYWTKLSQTPMHAEQVG